MGSGCAGGSSSKKIFGDPISDKQVIYTGPAYPNLGVCTGDRLDELEVVILNALSDYAISKGISVPELDLTQCSVVNEFADYSQNKSLTGVLDVLVKSICKVQSNLEDTASGINTRIAVNLDPKCLTISGNPVIQSALQAIINSHCELRQAFIDTYGSVENPQFSTTIINQITDDVTTRVLSNISSCGNVGFNKTGSGGNTKIELTGMVPNGAVVWYVGSLSNFDATGVGLPSKGFCGWYMMNGWNNTIDMRGYVPAGATNVQGPALRQRVDPVYNGDSSYTANMLDEKGEVKHALTEQELPRITPTGYSDPHNHSYQDDSYGPNNGGPIGGGWATNHNKSAQYTYRNTENATVTVNINPFGGNLKHENRQPTVYGCWIVKYY